MMAFSPINTEQTPMRRPVAQPSRPHRQHSKPMLSPFKKGGARAGASERNDLIHGSLYYFDPDTGRAASDVSSDAAQEIARLGQREFAIMLKLANQETIELAPGSKIWFDLLGILSKYIDQNIEHLLQAQPLTVYLVPDPGIHNTLVDHEIKDILEKLTPVEKEGLTQYLKATRLDLGMGESSAEPPSRINEFLKNRLPQEQHPHIRSVYTIAHRFTGTLVRSISQSLKIHQGQPIARSSNYKRNFELIVKLVLAFSFSKKTDILLHEEGADRRLEILDIEYLDRTRKSLNFDRHSSSFWIRHKNRLFIASSLISGTCGIIILWSREHDLWPGIIPLSPNHSNPLLEAMPVAFLTSGFYRMPQTLFTCLSGAKNYCRKLHPNYDSDEDSQAEDEDANERTFVQKWVKPLGQEFFWRYLIPLIPGLLWVIGDALFNNNPENNGHADNINHAAAIFALLVNLAFDMSTEAKESGYCRRSGYQHV